MAESAKAIGLRLPAQIWAEVEKYGLEHHPGGRGDKGFDVTQVLIELISRGLGIEEKGSINNSDTKLDERITELVKQQLDSMLDERITDIVRQQLDNSDTVIECNQKSNIVIQELTQKGLADRLKTSPSMIARAVKGGEAKWAEFVIKHPDPEGFDWQVPGAAGGKFKAKQLD
jgi:hypothetical protein